MTGRFEGVSLGKGMEAVQQAVAGMDVPPRDPRGVRRHLCGAAEIVPRSAGGAGAGRGAGVHRAAVRVPHLRARRSAILASALLSTSGVFLALLVTGTTFNISSFMGLIMVIGIVAKNGILLLDADQSFRAEGCVRARRHDRSGRAAAAADSDDRAGDHGGHDSAVAGASAPARRCCSRWRSR